MLDKDIGAIFAERAIDKPLVVETRIDASDIKAAAETCDDNDLISFEALLTDLVHKRRRVINLRKAEVHLAHALLNLF